MAAGKAIYRMRAMPNVYIQNLNIPHKKLAQEYFVRFCSTSSHASSSEQFEALVNDL